MKSTSIWFVCVATLALLEGNTIKALQCYTCENCIEGMDLRELQICGELPVDPVPAPGPATATATTIKPMMTQRPAVAGVTQTMPTTTTTKEISWEVDSELEESYDYSEDDETNGSDGVVQPMILPEMTTVANSSTLASASTTTEAVEAKADSLSSNKDDGVGQIVPATVAGSESEIKVLEHDTIKTDTDTKPGGFAESNAVVDDEGASESEEIKKKGDEISGISISTIGDTATAPIAVDENTSDYKESDTNSEIDDDRTSRERITKSRAFLKAVDPVCYMLQVMVNSTLVNSRGCTTMVADSKDLTCQSLDKGMPMAECRLCSTNGCNKFNEDTGDSGEWTSAADRSAVNIPFIFIMFILLALR